MTYEELQVYLDVEKWHESEKKGCDMCGKYARCRYCNRTEEFPCAKAFLKLKEMEKSPLPDPVAEGLTPEPPVLEKFGTERVTEEKPKKAPKKKAPKRAEPAPAPQKAEKKPAPTPVVKTPAPAPVVEEVAVAVEPAEKTENKRIRIATLKRK